MKIYRLFLLFVVCFLSFIAGWFLNDFYAEIKDVFSENPMIAQGSDSFFQKEGVRSGQNSKKSLKEIENQFRKNQEKFRQEELAALNKNEGLHSGMLSQKTDSADKGAPKSIHNPDLLVDSERSHKKEIAKKQKIFNDLNYKYIMSIPRNSTFFLKGEYSFLINVFSDEERALKFLNKLKKSYPLWNLFISLDKNNYKIYLGPFMTKSKAHKFMNAVPPPFPFPNYFLEKRSL